jgi:hypothetical protein
MQTVDLLFPLALLLRSIASVWNLEKQIPSRNFCMSRKWGKRTVMIVFAWNYHNWASVAVYEVGQITLSKIQGNRSLSELLIF